jgi:hypothetical protein
MEHENPMGEAFLESVRVGDLPSATRLLRQTPDLANVADRVGWYVLSPPPRLTVWARADDRPGSEQDRSDDGRGSAACGDG